jgi:isoleucyl-tRNA synthetase
MRTRRRSRSEAVRPSSELLRGSRDRRAHPEFHPEEIWQSMPRLDPDLEESVFLASWPEESASLQDEALQSEWDEILSVRAAVVRALERARSTGAIGHSLDAMVRISPSGAGKTIPHETGGIWTTLCMSLRFCASRSSRGSFLDEEGGSGSLWCERGEKCPRC